jgi:hypothetical protein
MGAHHSSKESSFNGASVRDVIIDLLLTALPPELRVSAPELADRVGARPAVAPHFRKEWSELTEAEGNIVARETALLALEIDLGAGAATSSGEHLH